MYLSDYLILKRRPHILSSGKKKSPSWNAHSGKSQPLYRKSDYLETAMLHKSQLSPRPQWELCREEWQPLLSCPSHPSSDEEAVVLAISLVKLQGTPVPAAMTATA